MNCPFKDPSKQCFILGSYPRSGNTMVRNYLEHYFHIQTWEEGPHTGIRLRAPGNMGLEKFPGAKVHAQKSHTPRRDPKTPALIIVRDPRDVVVSFAYFNRDLMEVKTVDIVQEFRARATHTAWSNFYLFWLHQRHLGGVEVIRYEDCLERIKDGTMPDFLQAALEKIGIEADIVTEEPIPSFADYKKVRPKFYRRGVAGGWKDELPPHIAKLCWQVHWRVAKVFGYSED